MLKAHAWVGGLALVSMIAIVGCKQDDVGGDAEVKRIIILTNGTSPFWDAAKAGARDAAKELKVDEAGLRVVVDTNDFSVQGQVDKLKQYAGQTDIAAVGISVTDSNNASIADEMRELRKMGIKVVAIDSDVDRETARDARFAYLGTDNVYGGEELGKAAAGIMPDGGTYATFVGLKGAANAKERIAGVGKGAGEKFKQVENMGDDGDPNVARKNVRDVIDRNEDIDLLVGIWSYNAPAIVDVLQDLKLSDNVRVVAFDAEPIAIDHMAEGQIDAMAVQNPYRMGYEGVRLLKALVEDDQSTIAEMRKEMVIGSDEDILDTGLKIVVPEGDSPLTADAFGDRTEFMKLDDFKAWLQSKGLTGS